MEKVTVTTSVRQFCEQDLNVPILAYTVDAKGLACYNKVFGTGFFIDNRGTFLTCRHVIESLKVHLSANPSHIAGIGVRNHGDPNKEGILAIDLSLIEYRTDNDVAIGYADYPTFPSIFAATQEPLSLLDVAAFGYPESATLRTSPDTLWAYMRSMKGYIQRKLLPDEIPSFRPHGKAFEISFQVPSCMSGSALVIRKTERYREIVGICVGAYQSEITEALHEEVEADGTIFRERRVRVEQFGFALDIESIMDWKPTKLNKTLAEVFHEALIASKNE